MLASTLHIIYAKSKLIYKSYQNQTSLQVPSKVLTCLETIL